jgi:DNA topoisomerase-1
VAQEGLEIDRFHYTDSSGKRITGKEPLERIASLVIPPAWKHVRISPWPGGQLQAVGMDTTGRIQYLYNLKFTEKQQRKKFAKIEKFGYFLPKLRKITNQHISLDGYPREKILAVVMRLINSLYFRVGTEESKQNYGTYGIRPFKTNI